MLLSVAMILGIASAFAAIVKPVINAQIIAYMGPTNDPTGRGFYEKALPLLGEYNTGRELEFIEYPAGLWPATGAGTLTLDASVRIGVQSALNTVSERDQPGMFLLGGSQSATVLSELKKYYDQHPEVAPPAEDLTFLLIANPSRPNGGMLARLPGLYIPGLDLTFSGPASNDQYVTYDVAWAYDGFANFPKYPVNILADINAYMGIKSLHGAVPDIFDPNNDVSVSVVGNTTYYTLMPKHLPLFKPMLDAGWGPLVSVIEPLTKVWVDAGYDNNDPRANPGIAESARLFMPLRNIVVALLRSPGAILQGLSTIPESIHQFLSGNPVTTVQNVVTSTVNVAQGFVPSVGSLPDVQKTVTTPRRTRNASAINTQTLDRKLSAEAPRRSSTRTFSSGDGVKKAVAASSVPRGVQRAKTSTHTHAASSRTSRSSAHAS